jgi:O-antigen/teichoic acid export membrane protein
MRNKFKMASKILMPFGISGNIYLLGAVGQGLGPIFLTPFLTRQLTPQEFGQVTYVTAVAAVFGVILSLGLPIVISRSYVLDSKSRVTISSWSKALVGIYLSFAVILFILNLNNFLVPTAILSISFSFGIIQLLLPFARARNQSTVFVAISIIGTLLPGLVIIISGFWGVRNNTTQVLNLGSLISSIIVLLLVKDFHLSRIINKKYNLSNSIKTGLTILPHMLAMIALVNVDKIIFGRYLDVESSGYIQIMMLVGTAPIMILGALNHAWLNQVLQSLKSNKNKAYKSINETLSKLFIICLILFIVIIIFLNIILEILNPYILLNRIDTQVVVLSASASTMYVIYLANTHVLTWAKKFWILAISTPISVLVQSIVIYLTLDDLGFLSAGLGLGIALGLQIIILDIFQQKALGNSVISLRLKVIGFMPFWVIFLIFISF